MTVLVVDDLAVLGVVDAALAEPDLVLVSRRERVVDAVLVDPEPLRLFVHRASSRAEAQGLNVLLRLGDPEVGHDLLELVLAPVVEERVRGRVRGIAGLADDLRPASAKETASVEIGERHRVVRRGRYRGRRILLIPKRLVVEIFNRIRHEDRGRAVGRARSRLRREGGRRDQQDYDRQTGGDHPPLLQSIASIPPLVLTMKRREPTHPIEDRLLAD